MVIKQVFLIFETHSRNLVLMNGPIGIPFVRKPQTIRQLLVGRDGYLGKNSIITDIQDQCKRVHGTVL